MYWKTTLFFYTALVIDTTLVSDNFLRFRKNLLERIWKLITTINDKIKNEKLHCDSDREATKISALSSGKVDKYEYPKDEDILTSDQSRIIEQANFTYFSFGEAFGKQFKIQILTIKDAIPENILNEETKNRLKKLKKKVDRENLVCRTNEYIYSFKNFRAINSFDRDIYKDKITLKEADEDQSNLLFEIMDSKKKRPQNPEKKQGKKMFLKIYMHFLRVEKEFLMLLKVKYFQLKLKVRVFQTRFLTILISNINS